VFVQDAGIAADNGIVYVAWEQDANGSGMNNGFASIRYAKLTTGATFGAPVPIDSVESPNTSAPFAIVRVAAGAGHAYVAWQQPSERLLDYQDVSVGGVTQSIPVDPPGNFAIAEVDDSGSLIVAGEGFAPTGSGDTVYTAIAPVGAAAPPAVRLTPLGISRWLEALAVSPDGTALTVIDRPPGFSTYEFDASIRPPGGAFAGLEQISGIQDGIHEQHVSAAAAAAPGGPDLVLWPSADAFGARNLRLHLSERDATPPAFSAITVPASTTVGERVALSAGATDAFSGAATISWDFGDGSHASGPSAPRLRSARRGGRDGHRDRLGRQTRSRRRA
jgi:hypothetical protein